MPTAIEVVDKFITVPEKITDVQEFNGEYFFVYGKHFFSVAKRTRDLQKYGEYTFYVYPDWKDTVNALIGTMQGFSSGEIPMVQYHISEFPDLRPLLVRLYKMLEEKAHNVDQIFGDVLNE